MYMLNIRYADNLFLHVYILLALFTAKNCCGTYTVNIKRLIQKICISGNRINKRDFLLFSGFLIDYSQLKAELMVNFGYPKR